MSTSEMKVLIVDDSQTNLALLNHLLSEQECDVLQAANGAEAIEQVKENEFALILLDIQMPGMNGYEVAEAIKSIDNGRHVPIIFITAIFQDQDNVKLGYEAGAVDYLFRPVDVQTLKSKVQVFLQLHRQKVQLQNEIRQRAEAERALRAAEEKFRSIFERAVEGIFQCSMDGTFREANPALLGILGYDRPEDLIGVPGLADRLMHDGEQKRRFLASLRNDGYVSNFEFEVIRQDGKVVWLSESSRLVRDENGDELLIEGVVEDVTRRKSREKELRHLATIDSLTGVPNRHVFFDRLEHAVQAARRYKTELAVLFVDLNDFKSVNDSFGHGVGDRLLGQVADRCLGRIRAADTFARIGGDEFGVLLERIEGVDSVSAVARGLIDVLEKPFEVNGRIMRVGATIGISLYPVNGDDAADLLSKADSAMYMSKRTGSSGYAFYRPVQ
ncbi:diguanylate cyclase [Pseudodesulfovibrio senegalensis]|uniref:Diguanylate cyclase n=2 Tax=Pseudodesulfovibrio senegalensis TaxID=1721087 RepID=A0A6N6N6F9_9BACT|nr:diguanylate cyclase [Pseudodesulfovibrio senegalensis]